MRGRWCSDSPSDTNNLWSTALKTVVNLHKLMRSNSQNGRNPTCHGDKCCPDGLPPTVCLLRCNILRDARLSHRRVVSISPVSSRHSNLHLQTNTTALTYWQYARALTTNKLMTEPASDYKRAHQLQNFGNFGNFGNSDEMQNELPGGKLSHY